MSLLSIAKSLAVGACLQAIREITLFAQYTGIAAWCKQAPTAGVEEIGTRAPSPASGEETTARSSWLHFLAKSLCEKTAADFNLDTAGRKRTAVRRLVVRRARGQWSAKLDFADSTGNHRRCLAGTQPVDRGSGSYRIGSTGRIFVSCVIWFFHLPAARRFRVENARELLSVAARVADDAGDCPDAHHHVGGLVRGMPGIVTHHLADQLCLSHRGKLMTQGLPLNGHESRWHCFECATPVVCKKCGCCGYRRRCLTTSPVCGLPRRSHPLVQFSGNIWLANSLRRVRRSGLSGV